MVSTAAYMRPGVWGGDREGQPLWGLLPWSLSADTVSLNRGSLEAFPPREAGPPSSSMSCSVFQCFIKISAAYGSTKDVSVYSVLGLPASQIFIVGRPTKKYQTQCQVSEGPTGG